MSPAVFAKIGLVEKFQSMRSMLSIKWKLIFAVVGVSFISLVTLMFINRWQAEQFLIAKNQDLIHETAIIEASRYAMALGSAMALSRTLASRVMSELEVSGEREIYPDTGRIANFVSTSLGDAESYIRGFGLILKPDVFSRPPTGDLTYFTDAGHTFIKFSAGSGQVAWVPPLSESELNGVEWWQNAIKTRASTVSEPYLTLHNRRDLPPGAAPVQELHVETRIVYPLLSDGEMIGVTICELCITEYQTKLQRTTTETGELRRRYSMLVSNRGACIGVPEGLDLSGIVLFPDGTDALPRLRSEPFPELLRAVQTGSVLNTRLPLGKTGEMALVSAAPVRHELLSEYWTMFVFQPEGEALAEARGTFLRQLYLGVAILLVSIVFGVVVAQMMSRTLTASERWYRSILDRLPLPLGMLDRNSNWTYANNRLAALVEEQRPTDMIGVPCDRHLNGEEALFVMNSNRPTAGEVETTEMGRQGNAYRVMSRLLLDSDRQYMGRLLIGIDITDAKRISQTLNLASAIAQSLDSKSERILAAAQTLSEGAMEKSAAIEEITSTTSEIGTSSSQYAASAKKSHELAEFTCEISGKSAAEAAKATEAMTAVGESGRNITKVIKLIDDIAFQTNLLALNAAVEAARAGRHGRGFAVVADEVRSLSGRSAKAAHETAAMIKEMTDRIGEAAATVLRLEETLINIRRNAENLSENSDQVAQLANTQSVGVKQVHASLEQISENVHATIEISRETAMVAESIFQQAAALRKLTREKHGETASPVQGALPPPESKRRDSGLIGFMPPARRGTR